MIRRHGVELLPGKGPRIVRELLDRPPPKRVDPLAWLYPLGAAAKKRQRLLSRLDPVPPHFVLPRSAVPEQVHVVVDEPREDGSAPQVYSTRCRAGKTADVLVTADRHDTVATHSDRLRDREPLVDGDDLAVRQDQIGRRGHGRTLGPQSRHGGNDRHNTDQCRNCTSSHRYLVRSVRLQPDSKRGRRDTETLREHSCGMRRNYGSVRGKLPILAARTLIMRVASGFCVAALVAITSVGLKAQDRPQQSPAEWRQKHDLGLKHRTASDLYHALKTGARGGKQNPPFSELPDWSGLWTQAGGGSFVAPGPAGIGPTLTAEAAAVLKKGQTLAAQGIVY